VGATIATSADVAWNSITFSRWVTDTKTGFPDDNEMTWTNNWHFRLGVDLAEEVRLHLDGILWDEASTTSNGEGRQGGQYLKVLKFHVDRFRLKCMHQRGSLLQCVAAGGLWPQARKLTDEADMFWQCLTIVELPTIPCLRCAFGDVVYALAHGRTMTHPSEPVPEETQLHWVSKSRIPDNAVQTSSLNSATPHRLRLGT
jgi:hypothetical protein